MLLFSDVPKNTIYKWTEEKGAEVYLTPSGYTDTIKRGGETGSNGLLLDPEGNLVLCQHGNRQMARMNSPVDNPKPDFTSLAAKYGGTRFSSPNDAAYNGDGELYFTDPPYGLEKQANDPKKEMTFNGVYKVKKNGDVILLTDSITRPNGIAFLPGNKKLIVANSDPKKPNWYIFDVEGDKLTNGKIFYSGADAGKSMRGLPDGFKVDKNGNIYASGPGGVWFFNSEGKMLGRLNVPNSCSNTALSADEKTLYVTNDMYVLRVKLRE
jgi:gluconolactonase